MPYEIELWISGTKGIHIDREVLEQIPYLRVTEGLLGLIDFESSPTRENAGAEHPSIAFGDKDRQSTPIFSPLCVETHDNRDAPLRKVCSDQAMGMSEAYVDSPYFRPIPAQQHEENKQRIAEMCNFGNKDNYHRQLQFNEYDTVIPSTNKYQVGTNNIQSGVNRVQPPTLQSRTYIPSPQQVQSLHQRLAQLQLGVNSYAQPKQQQNPATAPVSLPQQQLHQQQPAYQQPGYQPPNFVPRTQPPTTIGHPTSMFQPPRVGSLPQGPTQSFNQQNMSSITYPVMGQPTFSRPPDISNYQPQSHTLPVQQQQPPSSGAPPAHNNQPSARRKEYDSDYHERQRRRDPGRYYTADSDTSDASPYRQTRNKRRSAPAYLSDHSHRAFSPMRSARTSPAHSRHSSRKSLTARESQSESETDSGHSRSQSKKNKKIENNFYPRFLKRSATM
ncbi:Hypothetical predicted protein [Mytilus galloprovincialis]|uniref:Uncharacterized protein n=1 Tax=Mytilus galloprovincialis TaxID=29158 RepID=A0A8B6DIB0_MYTGA|nr:Hypothetical predicted protein [Mytilus galloprovincialis]